MSDETKNTDGAAGADNTATVAGADKTQTQAPGATGVSGVDGRIAGLTAEKKRWQEKFDAAQLELNAEREKNKSEQEKLLDAARKDAVDTFKAKEHDPAIQRLQKIESTMFEHLAAKLGQLPDEYKALVPESLPLDEKLAHVDKLLTTVASNKHMSIGGGVNPLGEGKKRTYTLAEIREMGKDPKVWEEARADVILAQQEGRITDLR